MAEGTGRGPDPVRELIAATLATPSGTACFTAEAPDWFGPRVFGGIVVAQALSAACGTVEPGLPPHSLHADFLGPLRPGPVELRVRRTRDGRTFSTREVVSHQDGRQALRCSVSFHRDEPGDEYQVPMPDVPGPEELLLQPEVDAPPPFEIRWVGPTEPRDDGTYRSTRRAWVRAVAPVADDPVAHLLIATFLSDMTGTSFRPHSLGDWGRHTDASIDHAVWFHRPFRVDDWCYTDFHALVNAGGRATVRGEFFDQTGRLCMSMAQELLIRPLP